ncbi:MAG TPA: hypothetical protein VJ249_06670 [Candidatus Bathyarchaeia archaeon]|nr:hypothetical protein [Candidatus Bathyarchaeia archaeon]
MYQIAEVFNTLPSNFDTVMSLSFFEVYRQQMLEAVGLIFLFGVVVGFLSPLYLAVERYVFLSVFLTAMPSFLLEVAVYFSAAILCLTCYWNVKKERLGLASVRGVVAAGLLIINGTWPASLLVLGAAVISSLCQKR